MSLLIEAEVEVKFDFDYEELAGRVVEFALDHEAFPYECEVNLTLTDNAGIHEINREYRQIDNPTDVLSFPMLSYEVAGDFSKLEEDYDDNFNPDTGEIMLGDIIIAEPNAYIAFAGKRVIEQTLNKTIPEGSQAAEYLFHKGLFDPIVPRNPLEGVLSELVQLHGFFPLNQNSIK